MRNIILIIIFVLSSFKLFENTNYNFSDELDPKKPSQYYIDEALKYFDSIDSFAPKKSKPIYSSHVLRWEWYPWLYLTGHKRWMMSLDYFLKWYPTKVIDRDCRFFKSQPFARCRVTFHYLRPDKLYKIYEEFTFNDAGEITFVEAWSDELDLLPMEPQDYWAEGDNVRRMSTKIPGLGTESGRYNKELIKELAKKDFEVAFFLKRLKNPLFYWLKEAVRFLKSSP